MPDAASPTPPRPSAFETDDGALRCYLDQLPPDRCLFCNTSSPARLVAVGSPASSTAAAGTTSILRSESSPPHGRAWLSVCTSCTPKVGLPAALGALVLGSTIAYAAIHGVGAALLQTVAGVLLGIGCFGVALHRRALRVGELDRDGHTFKIGQVSPEILREVLALGPAPHPRHVPRALAPVTTEPT